MLPVNSKTVVAAAGAFLAWCSIGIWAHAELLAPEFSQDFELQVVANTLTGPTSFDFLPDGSAVVTQKAGQVMHVEGGKTTLMGKLEVDTGSEKGLLSVVVPPDYAKRRHLLLYYSAIGADASDEDRNRVVSIDVRADGTLDLGSEKILVRGILGPRNHDAGGMTIGKDGYLYVAVGDAGCDSAQSANPKSKPGNFFATCLSNPNGKLLRIGLDGKVPSSNPFFGKNGSTCGNACADDASLLPPSPARPEIFAYGFRNPWRIWSDPRTGYIWVGDVGASRFEEIDVVTPADAGRHFGWPWREATTGYTTAACSTWDGAQPCVDPVYFCAHAGYESPGVDGGCQSITGGVIVDSCAWPSDLRNSYIYGDNGKTLQKVYALKVNAARDGILPGSRRELLTSTGLPVHFALGPEGDVYYVMIGTSGGSLLVHVAPKAANASAADCAAGGVSSVAGAATNGDAGDAAAAGAGGVAPATNSGASAGEGLGGHRAPEGGGPGTPGKDDGGLPEGAGEPAKHDDGSLDTGGCGCAVPGMSATSLELVGWFWLGLAIATRVRRRGRR